ncbi:MAG TPA: transporter substrate-binding domain-containing protein [Azospirillum sp.]|nr:transporter substrate-binding domain-containing protein [Azospirillum sp.]
MVLGKHLRPVALLAALLFPSIAAAQSAPLTIHSIDNMPQGRASDGQGIMTDAVMEAVKRAGLTGNLVFRPWARTQEEVSAGKDILITGLSRTPAREEKYTWVFPVFNLNFAFGTFGKPVSSFEEAKATLKHIAVAIGTPQHAILQKEGFSPDQIMALPMESQSKVLDLMLAGRADAWFNVTENTKYETRGNPEASKLVFGAPMLNPTQYIACSKNCSPDLVAKLKKALEEMKADGTIAAIVARYQ